TSGWMTSRSCARDNSQSNRRTHRYAAFAQVIIRGREPALSLSRGARATLPMIPTFRQKFNASYTPEKYQRFLQLMEERVGSPVQFRLSETPCFFPKSLVDQMAQYGQELIRQLKSLEYRKASFESIPPEFNAPHETAHPLFIQVDFGLMRDSNGNLHPKLVELQGFPSLYA